MEIINQNQFIINNAFLIAALDIRKVIDSVKDVDKIFKDIIDIYVSIRTILVNVNVSYFGVCFHNHAVASLIEYNRSIIAEINRYIWCIQKETEWFANNFKENQLTQDDIIIDISTYAISHIIMFIDKYCVIDRS